MTPFTRVVALIALIAASAIGARRAIAASNTQVHRINQDKALPQREKSA